MRQRPGFVHLLLLPDTSIKKEPILSVTYHPKVVDPKFSRSLQIDFAQPVGEPNQDFRFRSCSFIAFSSRTRTNSETLS
jgi:hypothetical protein